MAQGDGDGDHAAAVDSAGRPAARLFEYDKQPQHVQDMLESNVEGVSHHFGLANVVFTVWMQEYFFDGTKIVRGYVHREVKLRSVEHRNVNPTLDEIRKFDPKLLVLRFFPIGPYLCEILRDPRWFSDCVFSCCSTGE